MTRISKRRKISAQFKIGVALVKQEPVFLVCVRMFVVSYGIWVYPKRTEKFLKSVEVTFLISYKRIQDKQLKMKSNK